MGFHKTHKPTILVTWHRRIGLFVTGMLLVFTISGVALTHQSQWDPYYTVRKQQEAANDLMPSMTEEEIDRYLTKRYSIDKNPKVSLWEDSQIVRINYPNGISFVVDLQNKNILKEIASKRLTLYKLIHLHLNEQKGIWIIFVDVFAIGLVFLCVSGIYLISGRFTSAEAVFLIAGLLLPALFYLYL